MVRCFRGLPAGPFYIDFFPQNGASFRQSFNSASPLLFISPTSPSADIVWKCSKHGGPEALFFLPLLFMHFVGNLHNAVQMHLYASRCLMLALQLFLSSSAIFSFYSLWFHDQNEPKKNRIVFRNGFCCRTCRDGSLQSKILCSASNDTVLDDHARDSFYYCLMDILTWRSTKDS